jgi:hypothetical protein
VRVEPHTHVLVVGLVQVGRAGRDGGGTRGRRVHRSVLEVEGTSNRCRSCRLGRPTGCWSGAAAWLGRGAARGGGGVPRSAAGAAGRRPSRRGELVRSVGEGGAYGVVTARPVLLDPAEPLLVAGVDRRRAPTVPRKASAWARCRWSSSWLASTFHAMEESAVPAPYKIRVRGILTETLLGAFPGLHAQARRSQTVLVGPLPDQAALHGVLAWIEASGSSCWRPPPGLLRPGPGSIEPCDDSSPRPARTSRRRGGALRGRKERLVWGQRSSTCGSAADGLMDEMSGSTTAPRIGVPTAAAEDRRGTAAPCG